MYQLGSPSCFFLSEHVDSLGSIIECLLKVDNDPLGHPP
jgi:hypothetical protein